LTHALPRPVTPWVGAALGSIALGAAIAVNVQVAFLVVITFLGVAALAAPAGAWVLCALVAALTFRGLVEVNALPPVATFIDLPLAWGALAVGLLKRQKSSPLLAQHLRWLAAFGLAVVLAWVFHPSEVLRPVLYLTLLGEPFAIVGALLADPPSPRLRRALERTLIALLTIQIPIAALQLAALGRSDHIQGTLYGAGAGHHVIAAVIVVGVIWILSGGVSRSSLGIWRLPVLAALVLIPFLADAKQVILAVPAILLASTWRRGPLILLTRVALVAGSVVALFTLAPAGDTAQSYIEQAERGQGGKQATAQFVWREVRADPPSLAFGKGPAETVSRAAFMTTEGFQRPGSPLDALGLEPAALAMEAENTAQEVSHGGTSFNSGTSSALGVLGDLGIFGLLAYIALLFSLFVRLRRQTSAEGIAAAAGLALMLVLGLVFDWWEQPPFGVLIGVLAGLSLTGPRKTPDEQQAT
jgi:hypothetical protein